MNASPLVVAAAHSQAQHIRARHRLSEGIHVTAPGGVTPGIPGTDHVPLRMTATAVRTAAIATSWTTPSSLDISG